MVLLKYGDFNFKRKRSDPSCLRWMSWSSTKSSKLHAEAERNIWKCARVNSLLKLFPASKTDVKKSIEKTAYFQNKHPNYQITMAGCHNNYVPLNPQTFVVPWNFWNRPPCWPNDLEIDGTFREPKAWKPVSGEWSKRTGCDRKRGKIHRDDPMKSLPNLNS